MSEVEPDSAETCALLQRVRCGDRDALEQQCPGEAPQKNLAPGARCGHRLRLDH
jgi:hypothetical protein